MKAVKGNYNSSEVKNLKSGKLKRDGNGWKIIEDGEVALV